MPTSTTIPFTDEELSTIRFETKKEKQQTHLRPYRAARWFLDNHKNQQGGKKCGVAWETRDHSTGAELVNQGYDAIPVNVQPIYDVGYEDFFYYAQPTMISMVDQAQNQAGSNKLLDLVRDRTNNVNKSMLRDLEIQIMTGVLTNWASLKTLNGDGYASGILENGAPGTQTNVLHNQSRATYSSLPYWQNWYVDLQGQFSIYGTDYVQEIIGKMRDLIENESLAGFCTINFYNYLARSLQSNEEYAPGEGSVGAHYQTYAGIKWKTVQSASMPTAAQATDSGLPWSAVLLNADSLYLKSLSGYLMHDTGFRQAGGGHVDVRVAFQVIMAQLICTLLGRQGLIVNGESW